MRGGKNDNHPSPIHMVLVTDAWEPQVNGVVHSLGHICRILRAAGRQCHRHSSRPVPHRSLPHLCGDPSGVHHAGPHRPDDRGRGSRCGPYLDRGSARAKRAASLPQDRPWVHHQLSHQVPRICECAVSHPESWLYEIVRRFHNDGWAAWSPLRRCVTSLPHAALRI